QQQQHIVNFVLDRLPRIAPHRIASQVPGLLPAVSLPLPPPITAASSSAIKSSTQQATHIEHQRERERDLPPAPPNSKELGHTESTSYANARPQALSLRPRPLRVALHYLASLAPSSLSPALLVTVAATTCCPLLSTAPHSTAQHGIAPGPPESVLLALLCFASLRQKQGERDGAAKPESRFTANATATAAHAPPTATQRPCAPWLPFSLLSRDANSRPDLSLPLEFAPIDDTTSDQLIPNREIQFYSTIRRLRQ
ncbi:hypothetical protein CFIO01_02634, partial [Colletotrichum fioriniae PJ7]